MASRISEAMIAFLINGAGKWGSYFKTIKFVGHIAWKSALRWFMNVDVKK